MRKHVRAIVGAVKYMHAHGAVHRDLKPENVCLTLALLGLGSLLGLGLTLNRNRNQVLLSDAELTAEISPISPTYLPYISRNQVLLSDAEVTAEIRIVDLGLARFFSPEER